MRSFNEREPGDNKITRRDFLKIIGVTTAAFGAGKILSETKEALENNKLDVVLSLIKFRAAELYAKKKGWPLTEKTINHFLSGKGQNLDISNTVIESLRKSAGKTTDEVSDDGLIEKMFSEIASTSFSRIAQGEYNPETSSKCESEELKNKLLTGGSFPLSFTRGTKIEQDDFMYSLRKFGITVEGDVLNVKLGANGRILEYVGEFDIFDIYDWNDRQNIVSGTMFNNTAIEVVLRELGINDPKDYLSKKLGDESAQKILESEIGQFSNKDGYKLQSSGLADSYYIFTKRYNIVRPAEILVPYSYLG